MAAHPDLDALLNFSLTFAQQCLNKYGEFYPFGASKLITGEQRIASGWTGSDKPSSNEAIALLTDGYKEEARKGNIVAACICADVKITESSGEKRDAIRCSLEHKENQWMNVFLPYKRLRMVTNTGIFLLIKKTLSSSRRPR